MNAHRRAFTLTELMITVTIVAAVAVMAVPRLSDNVPARLSAASRVLASDIELAQVMTISKPTNPVVVRFDPDTATYWLAYASTPDTPITREQSNQPYCVVLGHGRAGGATGVGISASGVAANTLTFNSSGGMADLTSKPRITLSLANRWIKLDIATTTGSITESFGGGNE